MAERIVVSGNEAIARGAIAAGCRHFFGYPITPQSDIPEYFARELPKLGGDFVQSESESAAAAMVFGAAAAGVRAMSSTSGPGWTLMQEMMSMAAVAELPFVISVVQRGGPGQGTTRHAQMDYTSVTKGGGHGGYKNIVLAPASVQECFELIQLAFYLADRYRNPVVLLSDAILGQMMEDLDPTPLDFPPLPEKDWAAKGFDRKGGKSNFLPTLAAGWEPPWYVPYLERYDKKLKEIAQNEVRYQAYEADDADVLLVAFGYAARVCLETVRAARSQGVKVGLIRPITLWPFPVEAVRGYARPGRIFISVEDSLGQLVDDVRFAAEGRSPVHLVGALARHMVTDGGMLMPDRVLAEVERLL